MYMERRETAANSNEDPGHVATAAELSVSAVPHRWARCLR